MRSNSHDHNKEKKDSQNYCIHKEDGNQPHYTNLSLSIDRNNGMVHNLPLISTDISKKKNQNILLIYANLRALCTKMTTRKKAKQDKTQQPEIEKHRTMAS